MRIQVSATIKTGIQDILKGANNSNCQRADLCKMRNLLFPLKSMITPGTQWIIIAPPNIGQWLSPILQLSLHLVPGRRLKGCPMKHPHTRCNAPYLCHVAAMAGGRIALQGVFIIIFL